jgi:hypothetical protein
VVSAAKSRDVETASRRPAAIRSNIDFFMGDLDFSLSQLK